MLSELWIEVQGALLIDVEPEGDAVVLNCHFGGPGVVHVAKRIEFSGNWVEGQLERFGPEDELPKGVANFVVGKPADSEPSEST